MPDPSPYVEASAAVIRKNKQKNDKAVEVINCDGVIIARFRTRAECAKYLRTTSEAVSYHCSSYPPKRGNGVCNGLAVRPCCDLSDATKFGLFDGAEESRPKKSPQLKPETVVILKQWILSPEHIEKPYPCENEIRMLMQSTGLDKKQLRQWFNNARKRVLEPFLDRTAGDCQADQVVQVKRKSAPKRHKERRSKKVKIEFAEKSDRSETGSLLPQFGSLFGNERSGAGSINAMPLLDSIGMTAGNRESFGLSRSEAIQGNSFSYNNILQQQEDSQRSLAVLKQQVAAMAMKEANIAFKNMEEAYSMTEEIMAAVQSSSDADKNIELDPRVIVAIARAKKLHSVALFKLKVSKRASEEAEKAFQMLHSSKDV